MDAVAPSTLREARRRAVSSLGPVAAPSPRLFQRSRSSAFCSHVAVRRNVFPAVKLWSRCVMFLCALEHFIVRRRFPFKVVRLLVILAHGMIFEFVPHQNSSQIGMPIEMNSVEIENLPFLKFCASPHRSK